MSQSKSWACTRTGIKSRPTTAWANNFHRNIDEEAFLVQLEQVDDRAILYVVSKMVECHFVLILDSDVRSSGFSVITPQFSHVYIGMYLMQDAR